MRFKCGTQHMSFEQANCFECLNYKSIDGNKPLCKSGKNDSGFGCVLMDIHFLYQKELTDEVLNSLIPENGKCKMRLTVEEVKDEADKLLLKQNLELKQQIYNLKNGYNQLGFAEAV